MPSDKITPGLIYSVSVTVDSTNTAETVKSGGLKVFATPAMIALIERAAFESVEGLMEQGQTTVGTVVNVEHIAASPLGAQVTAMVTVEAIEGRKIDFTVSAYDNVGEVGRGTHSRFIIDTEKFMSKVQVRK